MLGRLIVRNDTERHAAQEGGCDLERVLATSDLVYGDNVFFAATGVTDGASREFAASPTGSSPIHCPCGLAHEQFALSRDGTTQTGRC
jgi:hypothetical protein